MNRYLVHLCESVENDRTNFGRVMDFEVADDPGRQTHQFRD